jgi:hypothetical protein
LPLHEEHFSRIRHFSKVTRFMTKRIKRADGGLTCPCLKSIQCNLRKFFVISRGYSGLTSLVSCSFTRVGFVTFRPRFIAMVTMKINSSWSANGFLTELETNIDSNASMQKQNEQFIQCFISKKYFFYLPISISDWETQGGRMDAWLLYSTNRLNT